ncbi:hypothetical protein AURDEDRAFT_186960 [Auricularia subglabra TFB-10046 SS5]|nr:hypothetical protein AURDEDRAFT_186960 [Auricularia subglabra TFB-10046 SS5]
MSATATPLPTTCTVSYSPTTRKMYLETPRGETLPIAILSVDDSDEEEFVPSAYPNEKRERGHVLAAPPYVVAERHEGSPITPLGAVAFLVAQVPLLAELAGYGGDRLGPFYAASAVFLYFAACVECLARKVMSVVVFLSFFWLFIGWAVAKHSSSLALLAGGGMATDPDLMMYAAVLTAILACNTGVVLGAQKQRLAGSWGY